MSVLPALMLLLLAGLLALDVQRRLPALQRQQMRNEAMESEARIVAELRAQLAAAQKVTEATVEGGNVTVRTVHKAIAAIPFGILESIPATRDTTRVVRRIHDAISDGIYGTISAANKAVHGAARNAVSPLQPESPPDRKDPPP